MILSDIESHRLLYNWRAVILLGISAFLSVGTILLLWSLKLHLVELSQPEWEALSFAGAAGALGIASLLVGMWLHWIKCDASSRRWKTIWFFALLLGMPYGAVPYYLFVYLPAVMRELQNLKGAAK
jgi:peptidoglycan biosynthesis protein MviN/MurJ (putative lipid II flippase)